MRAFFLFCAIAGAVAATAVSLAGAVSVRADILNIAWPIQLAAGLAALGPLVLIRTPRWRIARTICLLCAAALIVSGTPWRMLAPAPAAESGSRPALTVTAFNAWASNTDIDVAEALLREDSADIVMLQEIGLRAADLPARLADLHPHQQACRWGVRLISKHAFTASGCSDRLPAAWARITVDGREVTAVSVHIARPFAPAWYHGHSAALADLTASLDGPLIVAGDFNTGEGGFLMARQERALAPLTRATHGLRTWPSGRLSPVPLLGIDHVWLSEDLCAASVEVGPHAGSDHRPVSVAVAVCEAEQG